MRWRPPGNFLRSGAVRWGRLRTPNSPNPELMSRYWDRPMDFADATLVHLAKRESLSTIFTVDYADFETYRMKPPRIPGTSGQPAVIVH